MSKPFLKTFPIDFIDGETHTIRHDTVIEEQKINFHLNNQKLLSVMSLPHEQDAHILGFLISEGVIENLSDVHSLKISEDGLDVFIHAQIQEHVLTHLFLNKTLTSGCCVGVSGNMDTQSNQAPIIKKFIDTPLKVPITFIQEKIAIFEQPTPLFHETGCVHKASLYLKNTVLTSEDIGRHNAIDKVMGKAYLQKQDTKEGILFVSGRLSLEMVTKAVMHEIPIIVSKAAATFQGIKAAQELGITLIGFARQKTCNIYTHAGRIICSM